MERALSVERERARQFRNMHDYALQAFEVIARGPGVSSDHRTLARAEALRLRSMVDGHAEEDSADLVAALTSVAQRHVLMGLRVDLNTATVRRSLSPDHVAAVTGAVNEALTNVRKHAGTDRAYVRAAEAPSALTLTVLDRGRGFVSGYAGFGLRESVTARLREIGAVPTIESARGQGTCVTITVPT